MYKIVRTRRMFHLHIVSLFTFVLLDIVFIVIGPFTHTSMELKFIYIFDKITCFLLILDLLVIYKYSKEENISFAKHHILDIISIVPIELFYPLGLLRFLKLYKIYKILVPNNDRLKNKGYILENLLFISIIFTIIYFFIVSSFIGHYDYGFNGLFESLWFDIVSMTTVGYGDIVPLRFISKIFTLFTIIMGVFLISIFTAYLTTKYNEKPMRNKGRYVFKYVDGLEKATDEIEDKFMKIEDKLSYIKKDVSYLEDNMDEVIKLIKK